MPAYSSDKEQVEELKNLWKEYGRWLVLAVIVGLGISYGWRYWQGREMQQNIVASDQYQSILAAVPANNWEQVAAKKQVLQERYPSEVYTAMANMVEAKHWIDSNQYAKAIADFDYVIKNTKDVSFKQLARIRSARLYLAQNNYQAAKDVLATVDSKAFAPAVQSVLGNIALAEKQPAKAGQLYKEAFSGLLAMDIQEPLLAVKAMTYSQ